MAIDSAEKRKSAGAVFAHFTIPGVTPNATKDQEWRQESGWAYSGILAGNNVIISTIYQNFVRRKGRRMRARRTEV